MGSAPSQYRGDDDGDDGEPPKEKLLEQEPEILPCRASASPLSPQLSAAGTPRLLCPSIKVWDPCNVLLPPAVFPRPFFAGAGGVERIREVVLINHGECGVSLRPDLVGGRWPKAGLTGNGERQARALAVFLNSQGVRFNAVYCSPLDRARATAALVCRELDFAEDQIQSSDALVEMSHGQWEGCARSEIFTAEMSSLIDKTQPDFSPPLGESLRQVEHRMIDFVTALRIPDQLFAGDELDRAGPLHRSNRAGNPRKKSGKSRLQVMTTGDDESEGELRAGEVNADRNPSSVGLFTHATPIKCLVTCLLGCGPAAAAKLCVDDSSVTVLRHSPGNGWQIQRLNDTSHLRLL